MNPLTEARAHVTAVLEVAGVNVYPYPPDAPKLPAAWIVPLGAWAVPKTLTRSQVGLRLQVANTEVTRTRDALTNLEERSWAIIRGLRDAGVQVTAVSAPETQSMGTLSVSVVEIEIGVLVDDDTP